ncbi:hypothetical protein FQN52_009249 [Onygenales sp. PD_12]|nr:hypothetical protein FQN52_009249 [Onygenales sp. PD_12]
MASTLIPSLLLNPASWLHPKRTEKLGETLTGCRSVSTGPHADTLEFCYGANKTADDGGGLFADITPIGDAGSQ